MKKLTFVALITTFALAQGCAMERSTAKIQGDTRPCVTNYSAEGDMWKGKHFKTYEEFSNVSKTDAFEKTAAAIASSGFQITSSNKDLGIISASQAVSYSSGGKSVPFNAVVTSTAGGKVRVGLSFTLSGGLVTSADGIQEEFCQVLESVSH